MPGAPLLEGGDYPLDGLLEGEKIEYNKDVLEKKVDNEIGHFRGLTAKFRDRSRKHEKARSGQAVGPSGFW